MMSEKDLKEVRRVLDVAKERDSRTLSVRSTARALTSPKPPPLLSDKALNNSFVYWGDGTEEEDEYTQYYHELNTSTFKLPQSIVPVNRIEKTTYIFRFSHRKVAQI